MAEGFNPVGINAGIVYNSDPTSRIFNSSPMHCFEIELNEEKDPSAVICQKHSHVSADRILCFALVVKVYSSKLAAAVENHFHQSL